MQRIIFVLTFTTFVASFSLSAPINLDYLHKTDFGNTINPSDCISIPLDVPEIIPDFASVLDEPTSLIEFSQTIWVSCYIRAIKSGSAEEEAEKYAWECQYYYINFYGEPVLLHVMTPTIKEAINSTVLKKETSNFFTPKPHDKNDSSADVAVGNGFAAKIKYDGTNGYAVAADINKNRVYLIGMRLRPETILEFYRVSEHSKDYQNLFQWIEDNVYKSAKHLVKKKNMTFSRLG